MYICSSYLQKVYVLAPSNLRESIYLKIFIIWEEYAITKILRTEEILRNYLLIYLLTKSPATFIRLFVKESEVNWLLAMTMCAFIITGKKKKEYFHLPTNFFFLANNYRNIREVFLIVPWKGKKKKGRKKVDSFFPSFQGIYCPLFLFFGYGNHKKILITLKSFQIVPKSSEGLS